MQNYTHIQNVDDIYCHANWCSQIIIFLKISEEYCFCHPANIF